jgi:hypothetical protein
MHPTHRRLLGLALLLAVAAGLTVWARLWPRPTRAAAPAAATPTTSRAEKLTEAKRIVEETTRNLADESMRNPYAFWSSTIDSRRAVELAPDYAPAHRLLGRSQVGDASFDAAVASYQKALQLEPHDAEGARGLREAERLSALLRSLPLGLAGGRHVIRLVEVPRPGRPSVLVVIGRFDGECYADPEVRFFAWESRGYRETFRTADVGLPGRPSDLVCARTWVGDFQRVGRAQVIVAGCYLGADYEPTSVDVFEVKGSGLRHVLRVGSDHPPTTLDLDHDGRPEVRTDHLIGATVGHVGMGFWYDVYRYDGTRYVRANPRFPGFTRSQIDSIRHDLDYAPHDSDFLAHMAMAYRDLGQPRRAAPYERRAKAARAREEAHPE